jgi:cytidine deaminase
MKLTAKDKKLIEEAKKIIAKSQPVKLKDTSDVGAALFTSKGNLYRGVCVGFHCGIDSCGEYQAIGSMISNGEKEIRTIVAVKLDAKSNKHRVIPPCGKCREMIWQACKKNHHTEVIVSESKKVKLKKLLPHAWGGSIERE